MDPITISLACGLSAIAAGALLGRTAAGPRLTAAGMMATAIAAAAGLALAVAGSPAATWYAASLPLGGAAHAIALGLRPDAPGLIMVLLISGIGAVVMRYARTALRGDPRAPGFHAALAVVVAAALAQALSPGLVQFALGWIIAGVGLQRLFRHDDRAAALRAAAAKRATGLLGDLAMAVAIAALLLGPGTTDLAGLATADLTGPWVPVAAIAVALAVAARIALLPFQSWLLGTVEAPTPLSALMHAGVVNAGGFLVLLAAPLFAAAPVGLDLLLVLGLISAIGGPLAMWAQTDLKRSLAWSTVGQMGFMAVQCGLGAYASALLHLIGHGCYKADAFLRSGTLNRAVEARPPVAGPAAALAAWAVGTGVALAALVGVYELLGPGPAGMPGGWILVLVQALAVGQVLASPAATTLGALPRTLLVVPAAAIYGALTWGVEQALHGQIAAAPDAAARSAFATALMIAVPMAIAALTVLWVLLPALAGHPTVQAWRIHAGNGFYLPLLAERALRTLRLHP